MKAEQGLPANYARVVVDTNVLISAALSAHGAPGQLLRRLITESQLVFSPATFAEFESRLWKPKFDPHLTLEERKDYRLTYASLGIWVDDDDSPPSWSRDRDDDKFIALAQRAKVQRLITGDADLLCLDPLDTLRILTPRAALDEIEHNGIRSQ